MNEPSDVALPTDVTAPVRLAFVVTLPAVSQAAVPVILVPTNALGVPSAGVTRVGEVARTTLPLPVVVAALIAVPLPLRIPVTLVDNVIAGVVVGLATLPASPLALTTLTVLTVPPLDTANGTKVIFVTPIVIGALVVHTNIVSQFTVPSLAKTEALTNSVPESASVDLVGLPLTLTVYIPFSIADAWSLISILSHVTRTTQSTVSQFSKDVESVPATVVATRTGSFHFIPDTSEST